MFVLIRPGDVQEFIRRRLSAKLERNRLSTPYRRWVCVSRRIARRDFGLPSRLLAHTIDNIPGQLEVTAAGVPNNVGVGFITLEQRIDGLLFCPRIDFTLIGELLQENLKRTVSPRVRVVEREPKAARTSNLSLVSFLFFTTHVCSLSSLHAYNCNPRKWAGSPK